MKTLEAVSLTAEFVWVADRKAVYSYGPTYYPEFLVITDKQWEQLGKPDTITVTMEAQNAAE